MTRPENDQTLTGAEDVLEEVDSLTASADAPADGRAAAEDRPDPESVAEEADPPLASDTPELAEEQEAEAELRSEAERVQAEMADLHDRHLRLRAEFDNYRRRAQGELTESWVRAQADLVRRLLDPIDDIKRVSALDLSNATVENIMEGIDLVERKVMRALEEAGLKEIDPVGESFDPNIMEAMMRVPAELPEDDDRVHQVFLKGYSLKGHLVRPARVSVLKHDD
jgi:molecular chaperone GrpE